MQISNRKPSLAVVCLLSLVGSGCVWYAPLPTNHQPVSSRKTEDFVFLKWSQPLRSDVEAKLGGPDLFCSDLNVDVYAVQTNQRPKIQLLFCVIPVGFFYDYPGYESAFIKFDNSCQSSSIFRKLVQPENKTIHEITRSSQRPNLIFPRS